ncbi:hypothetical protein Prudu_015637 [Prunus dulcis]|uniref:Uncharacterized protein n=1 Tax=Prunus dulcis TaxID=3755 RepID=A0A4Y1RJS8_PRUDU|nr:hypothetical protein Prudu_015637 [Prunus dulcis]
MAANLVQLSFLTDKEGNDLTDQINPAFEIWHDKDQAMLTWMRSTCSEHVLPFTAGLASSRELWLNLEKRFQVVGVSSEYRRNLGRCFSNNRHLRCTS